MKSFPEKTAIGAYLETNPFAWIEKSKAKREERRARLGLGKGK